MQGRDVYKRQVVECPEHIALSLEASKRSMVLLKNDNHFLPLKQEQVHTIAVIGPNANSRAALVGNYEGTSSRYITPVSYTHLLAWESPTCVSK